MTSQNVYTTRRLRVAPLAVVAAAALALSGCNSGSDPDTGGTSPSPSASVSASVTPSATPSPAASYKPADAKGRAQNVPVPVLPEVAKTETKEGLEAFARYWFQLLSYSYETGDVSQISAITSAGCTMCERAKEVQKGWYDEGRWLSGGKASTPADSTNVKVAADGNYQVAVQVSQEAV